MKNFFSKTKKFILDHQHSIRPPITFAAKCVNEIATLTQLEKSSVYSYINCALKCKEQYEQVFQKDDEEYFANENWELFSCEEFWNALVKVLECSHHSSKIRVIKTGAGGNSSSGGIFILPLTSDIKVGWVTRLSGVYLMYVSRKKSKELKQIIGDLIWKLLDTNTVFVDAIKEHGWRAKIEFKADEDSHTFIKSKALDSYSEHILKFKEKGYGRSVLFYGPPGSGKSNIVKGITNVLSLRTLRVQDLNNIRNRALAEVIDIFAPDVVVLEDIDHIYGYEIASLLEKIEDFNKRNKYVLATANEVKKINSALLRPGRFDELIEITRTDNDLIKTLVKNDEELYDLVKDYPIAFINEIMKRVDSIGKEAALKSIDDIKKRIENFQDENYKL